MLLFLFGTSIASSLLSLSWLSALYWYYKNTVLSFVWYSLVFIKYSYYCDLVCSWPSLCLRNRHCHVWVRYIHTTKIMVVCMSLLLLSIDIRRIYYFIMFYFKLTNGEMEKWWIVKWCNGEINNRTGHLFSHKFWIRLFVLFSNTTFFLISRNKQTLIMYFNTLSFVVVFLER